MSLRFYKIGLITSLLVNAILIAAMWAYIHFEGMWSIIQTAVGIFG